MSCPLFTNSLILTMKFNFLVLLFVFSSLPVKAYEMILVNPNRVCSAIVGIPYASDNFTDKEWEKFKECLKFINSFKNRN